ncbi:MAG: ABC transporter permease [Thermoprotei archaeon]
MALPNVLRLVYRNLVVNMDPGSLVILVGLPSMYLVFMGYGFQSLVSSTTASPDSYIRFLAPGILAFQTVIAGTVGGSMLWMDRRLGMLAQLLSGPFTRIQYLLGIILASVVMGLAGTTLLLAVAYLMLHSLPLTAVDAAVMYGSVVVGSLFFGALMLLIAALVRSNNAYNSIQILVLFFVNFASTVFYPLSSSLPSVIRAMFVVNPLTYVADNVRAGFLGVYSLPDGYEFALLVAESAVVLVVAARAYMRANISFE